MPGQKMRTNEGRKTGGERKGMRKGVMEIVKNKEGLGGSGNHWKGVKSNKKSHAGSDQKPE